MKHQDYFSHLSLINMSATTALGILLIVLVVVAYTGSSQSDIRSRLGDSEVGTCDLVPLLLTIHPPPQYALRCASSKVMTFGCRGHCTSYVKAVPTGPYGELHRHCSCCQPTKFGVQLAAIRCNDGTKLRAALKFALECLCRPCQHDDIPEVVMDYQELQTEQP